MKYEIPPTSPASLEGNYDCLKDVRSVESNKLLIVYFQGRQQSAFNQLLITARELLTLLKIIRKQKRKIFFNYFHPGNWDFTEKKEKTPRDWEKEKKKLTWWHIKYTLLANEILFARSWIVLPELVRGYGCWHLNKKQYFQSPWADTQIFLLNIFKEMDCMSLPYLWFLTVHRTLAFRFPHFCGILSIFE